MGKIHDYTPAESVGLNDKIILDVSNGGDYVNKSATIEQVGEALNCDIIPISSNDSTSTKDYIDNRLTWILLGTLTGAQTLILPNGWNEAFVVGKFGGNAQYGFTSYIISAHTGNPYRFINGCGQTSDNHQIIWKIVGSGTISFDSWKYNGNDYTSTSSLIVYYR